MLNVLPGEPISGLDYQQMKSEFSRVLDVGDMVEVVVDSQFRDKGEVRRIGQTGKIVEII